MHACRGSKCHCARRARDAMHCRNISGSGNTYGLTVTHTGCLSIKLSSNHPGVVGLHLLFSFYHWHYSVRGVH
jgi:hypothetical protein